MSEELVNDIKDAIAVINDPHMGISIVEMGIVQNIAVDGDKAEITLKPTNTNYDESTYNTEFSVSLKETLIRLDVVDSVYDFLNCVGRVICHGSHTDSRGEIPWRTGVLRTDSGKRGACKAAAANPCRWT